MTAIEPPAFESPAENCEDLKYQLENLKNQLKEVCEEARAREAAQRETIVDLRNEVDRLKRKYLFLNAELNAIHGADRGDAETESRWLDMQLRTQSESTQKMNRAPRTLPSRYGFYTYPLYPADVRLPPPTPVTGLLAVLPGDFEAPWFIEHQIELETANKNLQNGVAAMNVSCQRTNESPDNKDTENHQLREQLNVLTQKLQMFTSRKAQDDRQIQQFRKFSTDQVAERNTLILKFDRVQEENHMLKSERELMTRKIKSLETMLRNGTEERRIERENFDSHQKESKLDLLAHKNHIEELTNEVNDLRDIVSIQKASSIAHKTENDELSMRIEKHMKIESNLKESLKTVLERTGKIRLELEQTREQQHNQDKEYREVLKQAQLDNDTLTKSNEKKDEEILRLKAEKLKGLWSTTPTKSVTIVRNCQKRHYEDDDDEWLPNSERKKRSVKEERFH